MWRLVKGLMWEKMERRISSGRAEDGLGGKMVLFCSGDALECLTRLAFGILSFESDSGRVVVAPWLLRLYLAVSGE